LRWLWDPSFSVGVEQLDRQHQSIFERLAEAEKALATADLSEIVRALEAVRRDSEFHFRAEEEFLSGLRYPAIVRQQVHHREFLKRLTALEAHPEQCSQTVLSSLESWLAGHVIGLDAEYARWMAERAEKTGEK
jgi:hemerythrin